MTYYRGFSGEHAFLDPKVPEGVGIQMITDGTSNTIAVVEAREAVPWTRPESDIPFGGDPAKVEAIQALRGELGGHFPGGFHGAVLRRLGAFHQGFGEPGRARALSPATAARSSRPTRIERSLDRSAKASRDVGGCGIIDSRFEI